MSWDEDGPRVWMPYAVTAVCGLGGLGLRLVSGPGALAVAALVLLAPAGVVAVAHRLGRPVLGVDRALEVGYVAGALAALAGWTVAAGTRSWPAAAVLVPLVVALVVGWVAYGPWRRVTALAVACGAAAGLLAGAALNPLGGGGVLRWGAAWAAGTTAAAAPYWLHLRHRRRNAPPKVDVDKLLAAVGKHLHHEVTLVTGSLNVGEHGRYSVRLRLTDGRTAASVQQIVPAVESELSLRAGAVMVAPVVHRRDEVTMSVTPKVPRSEAVMPELPESITEPVAVGVHDNGDPLLISVYDETGARGTLVGGEKGSGKSRLLATALKAWTHCEDALIIFADFSGGTTSEPWLPRLHGRITDPARFVPLLNALLAEARARAASLPERGWESWQPSPECPAILFVIDEAQAGLKDDFQAQSLLGQLIQVDRKSGMGAVAVAPIPVQTEGISPTIREQCRLRLCFRSSGKAAQYVLGDTPAAPVAYTVTEFDQPGQMLASGPKIAPLQGRTYDTDLAAAKAAGLAHADRKPSADGILTKELREFFTRSGGEAEGGEPAPEPNPTGPEGPDTAAPAADDAGLRDTLLRMVNGPGVLGQAWPEIPAAPPKGRLSTETALQVVAAMVRQPDGASPADIQQATGRKKTWVHATLSAWHRDGLVESLGHGRWRATLVDARAGGGAEGGGGSDAHPVSERG